jgi:hypothetical protein
MKLVQNLFFCFLFALAGVLFVAQPALAAGKMKLVSVKTSTEIALDAASEKAWDSAEALTVDLNLTPYKPSNGYDGMKQTTLTIKSLYDNDNVYFYIQYKDPTQSLARFPWVKQSDGSWKQLAAKDSTGHDNTYYEDKLGFFWDISTRGFKKKGCDIACHMTKDGMNAGVKDKSAGRKFTRKKGETIDMWHWKGVRTNALGMFDDQFVDHVKDPKANKNWGRHGDAKTGGGYKNNVNKAKNGPMYMNSPYSEDAKYFVVPWYKAKFVDNFKTGDVVPGIVLDPFTGHRADIKVKGAWQNGQWTLEVKRSLKTTGKNADIQDVQFTDMSKSYYFGLSVFDNSQINHIYHEGAIEFKFQ